MTIPATGENRFAGLARWTEGAMLAEVLRETDDTGGRSATSRSSAPIMAAMHDQASALAASGALHAARFDADGLMGNTPYWGRFWEHPSFCRGAQRCCSTSRRGMHASLERWAASPSVYSMIHADMHPGNVLVDGDRLTVIDFDDAGFGWHPTTSRWP